MYPKFKIKIMIEKSTILSEVENVYSRDETDHALALDSSTVWTDCLLQRLHLYGNIIYVHAIKFFITKCSLN